MKFISSSALKVFSILFVFTFLTSLPNSAEAGMGLDYHYVHSANTQPDGKIIITGDFFTYDGVARQGIARLNADSTLDTSFNPNTEGITIGRVFVQPGGKIFFRFTDWRNDDVNFDGFARLNADGTLDTTFNPEIGADGGINAVTTQSDGKILIGGYFTTYDDIARNGIARLNADGTLDTTFTPQENHPFDYLNIQHIVVQPSGKIIIAGNFANYDGTMRLGMYRLNADGTFDSPLFPDMSTDIDVRDMVAQPDGKILVGGVFTDSENEGLNFLERINADGFSLDESTFDSLASQDLFVENIALQSNGKIVVIGNLNKFTTNSRIARLNADGTLDTTFNPDTGISEWAHTITVQSDDKIIITGEITANKVGLPKNGIARLNADGTLDTTFGSLVTPSDFVVKIISAPTKTTYNEGDVLDLSGLVVTIIRSDSSTMDVAFADFADNEITTSKEHGSVLNTGDTAVTITAYENTIYKHTAEQSITVISNQEEIPDDTLANGSVDNTHPEVVLTDINEPAIITIEPGTIEPKINLDAFITDGTGVVPQITLESVIATIEIPDQTTITSTDPSWDGIMAGPTITEFTLPGTTVYGGIDIGFSEAKLLFNKGVRIELPNQAGKKVGYTRTGEAFTEITTVCTSDTQTAGDALGEGGDCKMDVGTDLVIWTKHFTTFASYSETTTNRRGGGGSLINKRVTKETRTQEQARAPKPVTVQVPAQALNVPRGAVQGASKFQFGKDLALGTTMSDVRELQKMLRAEGFFNHPEDTGYFGEVTREAVMAFQRARGIVPATGYVGPLTRAELNKGTTAPAPTVNNGVSLQSFVELLISLGIVSADKADQARAAFAENDEVTE